MPLNYYFRSRSNLHQLTLQAAGYNLRYVSRVLLYMTLCQFQTFGETLLQQRKLLMWRSQKNSLGREVASLGEKLGELHLIAKRKTWGVNERNQFANQRARHPRVCRALSASRERSSADHLQPGDFMLTNMKLHLSQRQ